MCVCFLLRFLYVYYIFNILVYLRSFQFFEFYVFIGRYRSVGFLVFFAVKALVYDSVLLIKFVWGFG